jgi:hypothetical protein
MTFPQRRLDLLAYISGDELDGCLHFRHDPLGFIDPIEAGRAEAFLLGHGANAADLRSNISRNEPTVSAHAALQIDNVVDLADRTDALGDPLALSADALELLARRLRCLYELL